MATQQHAKIARVRKRGLSLSLSEDANVLSARKQTNSTKKETYLGWNNCRGKRSRQHFDETLSYSSARKLCGSSNFSRETVFHRLGSQTTPQTLNYEGGGGKSTKTRINNRSKKKKKKRSHDAQKR